MNTDTTIYTLKGHAQRLQKGLEALGRGVTRTQALDLVAQMHGKRNWKELTGLAQADQVQKAQHEAELSAWLNRLFYVLKMDGIIEGDLDGLVHDVLDNEAASSVNNQGMLEQLTVLLEAGGSDRNALVALLEDELSIRLSMPEGRGDAPVVEAALRICYGFPEEAEHQFDALDWALQATAAELAGVVKGDYRNCDATDEIGLWMERHAPNINERTKIHQLLEAMRAIVEIKPDRTGITLDVDASNFGDIVALRYEYDNLSLDDETLHVLGLTAN